MESYYLHILYREVLKQKGHQSIYYFKGYVQTAMSQIYNTQLFKHIRVFHTV